MLWIEFVCFFSFSMKPLTRLRSVAGLLYIYILVLLTLSQKNCTVMNALRFGISSEFFGPFFYAAFHLFLRTSFFYVIDKHTENYTPNHDVTTTTKL